MTDQAGSAALPAAAGPLPLISIVVPVFNEEASIDLFLAAIAPVLDGIDPAWEVVFVNDGSRDGTLAALRAAAAREPRVRAIDLSRNYGKEVALSAGLDHARGRAVVPMDVDLQDPPELLAEMVARWREGYDVVLACRSDRTSDGYLKRTTARMFYSLIGRLSDTPIPADVGDYRLMDASVAEALRRYPERMRFMKGLFAHVGFRTATVEYVRAPRAAGETKFNGRKLFNLALEGIVSFSTLPLKIWTYIGLAAALLAVAYLVFLIADTLINGVDVPGYASLLSVMLFFNGLMLMGLGVLGEYVARIFIEVKGRPLYLVRERIGD
ncbi:glycosyltransferase family 2 protein [Sandarakinorhabdus rubra]|uniref:glycosyltransferase family 2 protein n=1 Tax=Sandarakinorhabdus rubra TaxID=2672568 RepID=UPI001F302ED3|nr:glycosyltransferase family 2 protein [Sandarakinorhabdus rubra]